MKKAKGYLAFGICMMIFLMAGCQKVTVGGKWYCDRDPNGAFMEFDEKNNSVRISDGGYSTDGTYSLSEDHKNVYITTSSWLGDITKNCTLNDDGSMKDESGAYAYFKDQEKAKESHDRLLNHWADNFKAVFVGSQWKADNVKCLSQSSMNDLGLYSILIINEDGSYEGSICNSKTDETLAQEKGNYVISTVESLPDVYLDDKTDCIMTFEVQAIEDEALKTYLKDLESSRQSVNVLGSSYGPKITYERPKSFYLSGEKKVSITSLDGQSYKLSIDDQYEKINSK